MKPRRSIRDAALQSMAIKQASPDKSLAPMSLERVAKHRAESRPMPAAPAKIEMKVVARPGQEARAAAWIRQGGGTITSEGSGVIIAQIPPPLLNQLEQCPGIRRAEAPRRLLRRLNEACGPTTGCAAARATHGLDGTGVLVGIVDTGVDWKHADFSDAQGKTRLERFAWARQPEDSEVSQIDEFDEAALNAALGGGQGVPAGDPQGHGTHCASIAIGNGRASNGKFQGCAPGARLVAVRSEPLLDTHTIWGIRKTFELAGNRPAVVTLSLGGHLGAHDGTSAIEDVISRESGPGRIVVVAAGNEGQDSIHFRGEVATGQDLVIPVRINDRQLEYVDVWVPRGDDVTVEIETPDGVRHQPDGQLKTTVFGQFEAHWQEDPINRDQNLTLFVAQGRLNHTWNIRIHGNNVSHGEVHAWAGTVNGSTSAHLFQGADDRYSIGMPATEERCLAVASFVSRHQFEANGGAMTTSLTVGQLSTFSSRGPTRYGAMKPDVAAPGQYITAALAAGSEMATDPAYVPRHHPNGKYVTIQGTSMATPFVAGVIALLLQREPKLTPEAIQQRLRITARRDAHTHRVWDPGFGFGKIDVQALLDYTG